jgi:hypothetical protein
MILTRKNEKNSYEFYISNFDWQFSAGFFIIDDLNKGPSIYYVSAFLNVFGLTHYTEVCFVSFISSGFITAIVVNSPEKKLAKRTSVHFYISINKVLNVSKYGHFLNPPTESIC